LRAAGGGLADQWAGGSVGTQSSGGHGEDGTDHAAGQDVGLKLVEFPLTSP
jgi:hypothetical protein